MATTKSAKKDEQLRLRKELSEKAVAFYAQHNVSQTLEKLLNQMFVAAPNDVYGYMSEHFSRLSAPPVICAARCAEGLDDRGERALDVSIHCTVHGVNKHIASVSISIDPHPAPPTPPSLTSPSSKPGKKASELTRPEDDGKEGTHVDEKLDNVTDAYESFNNYIAPRLLSHPPDQQVEIDKIIASLRDKDGRELHSSALLATSLAVAQSAALLAGIPLYDHLICTLTSPPHPSSLSLPTPVTSLLAGGCGKLKVREFCLIPLPGRALSEQISALCSVHRAVGALLSSKTGVAGGATLPGGAYCPVLDRLEAGLDLVREAATQSGLTLGEDLSVIIDVGANRLYDQEKCKYELVTGQWKTSQEVMSIYSDLLSSHPGVFGYIDPLHHKDVEGWKKLQETLGNKCLLVADKTFNSLPISSRRDARHDEMTDVVTENETEGEEEEVGTKAGLDCVSCAALTLDATLSTTFSKAVSVARSSNDSMMCVPPALTVTPLLVDLAVALQCNLLRMMAPLGLTSSCLLSRMLQIREELSSKGIYEPTKALVFSSTHLSTLEENQ